MKVGDLVQLSSYGGKRRHNIDCWGGWGFIVKIHSSHSNFPIVTHWYKANGAEIVGMNFHPRELKRFKADKK